MFRELLQIASRVGRPGTVLRAGDSEGRLLYLEAAMSPVSVIVALDHEDVAGLHAALGEWLADREDLGPTPHVAPPLYRSDDGRSWSPADPAPLVAGRIGAGLRDAGRIVNREQAARAALIPQARLCSSAQSPALHTAPDLHVCPGPSHCECLVPCDA